MTVKMDHFSCSISFTLPLSLSLPPRHPWPTLHRVSPWFSHLLNLLCELWGGAILKRASMNDFVISDAEIVQKTKRKRKRNNFVYWLPTSWTFFYVDETRKFVIRCEFVLKRFHSKHGKPSNRMPNWQCSHVFNKWNLHIFDDFRLQRINEKYIYVYTEKERETTTTTVRFIPAARHRVAHMCGECWNWNFVPESSLVIAAWMLNVHCWWATNWQYFSLPWRQKKHTQTYPPQRNHHISVVCASAAMHDQISIHIESPQLNRSIIGHFWILWRSNNCTKKRLMWLPTLGRLL